MGYGTQYAPRRLVEALPAAEVLLDIGRKRSGSARRQLRSQAFIIRSALTKGTAFSFVDRLHEIEAGPCCRAIVPSVVDRLLWASFPQSREELPQVFPKLVGVFQPYADAEVRRIAVDANHVSVRSNRHGSDNASRATP